MGLLIVFGMLSVYVIVGIKQLCNLVILKKVLREALHHLVDVRNFSIDLT
jgi:hypothetical protein